jgi:hypothetical protein
MIKRTVRDLLQHSDKNFAVSFLEVYMDNYHDLHTNTNLYASASKIEKIPVVNVDQFDKQLHNAIKNRRTDATNQNTKSSRSHMIVTFYIQDAARASKLSFVDLAGLENSEAAKGAKQSKEAGKIRVELSAITNQLRTLKETNMKDGTKKKLSFGSTRVLRVLRDSMEPGSSAKVLMINCIIGSEESQDATKYVLETSQNIV